MSKSDYSLECECCGLFNLQDGTIEDGLIYCDKCTQSEPQTNNTFSPLEEQSNNERQKLKPHSRNQIGDVKSGNAVGRTEIQAEGNKKNLPPNNSVHEKHVQNGCGKVVEGDEWSGTLNCGDPVGRWEENKDKEMKWVYNGDLYTCRKCSLNHDITHLEDNK